MSVVLLSETDAQSYVVNYALNKTNTVIDTWLMHE